MTVEKILGVDPGLARLGYGVVEARGNRAVCVTYGCIETPSDWPGPERLRSLFHELRQIIAAHQPTVMAIEELFFYRNTTTAFAVGQARGVALLAGVEAGLRITEFTPMQVKMAVTGYGKAQKRQVQEMVRVLLNLGEIPKPDDAADALAVALTEAHCAPLQSAVFAADGKVRDRRVRYGRGGQR